MTNPKTVNENNYEDDYNFLRSDMKKRNYSEQEIIFELEIKQRKIKAI